METKSKIKSITNPENIEEKIYIIRGQKVMFDSDLAIIYGTTTKVLNQSVKRNSSRFPIDFMFQLTTEEERAVSRSRSQIVTLKRGQNIKYKSYVFTEHGTVMLASILKSQIAIAASIQVVRAFVRMRSLLAAHKELAKKIEDLEKKHNHQAVKTEIQFKSLLELIKKAIQPPQKQSKIQPIGFKIDK